MRFATTLSVKIASGFAITLLISYATLAWKGDTLRQKDAAIGTSISDTASADPLLASQNVEWSAGIYDQELRLSGGVPSLEAKARLAALAKAQFPNLKLNDQTRVVAGLPEASWEQAIRTGLTMMAQVGSGALVLSSISGLSLTGIVADAVTRERLIYALPGSMPQDIPGRALLQLPEEAAFLAQQEAERRAASALGKTHPCQADIDRVMAGNPLVFVEEEARLEESATQTLEQLGKILTNCGPLNLEITAYATSVQGTMIAQTLSAQRGQLVADALSAMGIDKNLIRVTGAGPPPPERLDTNLISLKATLVSP